MSEQVATAPLAAPRRQAFLIDASTMAGRTIRLSARNLEALLTSVMLPAMILLLFVYLFGGAIQTGVAQYVDYVLPGLLLLCTGFVSALTAVSVSQDMHEGIIDRLRSMDVRSTAVLGGHVASSLLRNAVSVTIIVAIALAIGFRPVNGPLEWLAAAGVLFAFVLAMTWLSVAFGLLTKSPEGAGGFQFFIMFLPYPSSAFVPVETMPTWLHGFANHQPATPIIETVRGLVMDTPIGSSAWIALGWCAGITLVAVVAAGWLFRRRSA